VWAVVGLGNPGKRYRSTRHNAGFLFVSHLAGIHGKRLRKRAYMSRTRTVEAEGEQILLAQPQTYMNRSGLAVKRIVAGGVQLERLIVVYDDLDLTLGEIRIRKEGSAGSHLGMRSIVQALESKMFPRIRIGIGFMGTGWDAAEYVLSEFSEDEKKSLREVLEDASDALCLILQGRIDEAMNRFNQKLSMN
jgi:PTH1 family peptidyl-tRNA hydrolase